jgi:hypothetical protein
MKESYKKKLIELGAVIRWWNNKTNNIIWILCIFLISYILRI